MSKRTKKQPSNVVNLAEFRAKRDAEQWVSTYTKNVNPLRIPPVSEETKKWLEQYGDL
jgi:hypothetical protein